MSSGVPRHPRRHTVGELAEAVNEIQCDTKKLLVGHAQLSEVVRSSVGAQRQTNKRLEQLAAENRQLILELHADQESRLRTLESDRELKARLGCDAEAERIDAIKTSVDGLRGRVLALTVVLSIVFGGGGAVVGVLKWVGVM